MQTSAVFFDGEYAHDRPVTVQLQGADLLFSGPNVGETRWSVKGLHPIDPPSPGQPFRITHDGKPGARIVLRDEAFISALIAANSRLKGGYGWSHLRDVAVWTIGGIAVVAALGWVLMSILPQYVAQVLPDGWRNRVGTQIVDSLVEGKKQCHSPAGDEAKSAMIAVLAEGNPDLPPISMEVYDLPIVNAFAAPGGKIIFTRQILAEADGPDEIAGVLAHEIGHIYHRHPEAQLVRMTGLQVLISVATGTNGGDYASNIAALAALLRYSREAEREADEFARSTLDAANVDPMGLRRFFEKIMKIDKDKPIVPSANEKPSVFERIGNVFSTHPGTEERIAAIQPLPAGRTPVTIMTQAQWTALKEICK